jgi:hypothetical protein
MAKKSKGGGASKKALIAAAIAACARENGDILPADVVEAAREEDSILHGEFEWRESRLVQQALEQRAAELIKQCRSMLIYEDREIVFPQYLNNTETRHKTFTPTRTVAANDGLKRMTMDAELSRISSAIHRAMSLAIVFGIAGEFEDLLQRVVAIQISLANRKPRDNGKGGGKGGGKGKKGGDSSSMHV